MRKKIVIAIFMLVAASLSFFVYRDIKNRKEEKIRQAQENCSSGVPAEAPVEVAKETREACLERVKNFDAKEMAGDVLRLKYAGDIYKETGVETNIYGSLLMIKSLNCDLIKNKNENNLKTALDLVRKTRFPAQAIKYFENWLWDTYAGTYASEFPRLGPNLALGDLKQLCPAALPKICEKETNLSSPPLDPIERGKFCSGLCSSLVRFGKNEAAFTSEILNNDNLLNGSRDLNIARVMIAYRFKGEEAALKMCDKLPEEQKTNCQNSINRLEPNRIKCEHIAQAEKDLVCDNVSK